MNKIPMVSMSVMVLMTLWVVVTMPGQGLAQDVNARELLVKMDDVLRGPSHDMRVFLDVKTKRWERKYEIRVQMKGLDYAFARVLKPPKSEGQGFLRIKTRLWQYLPTAERTILIPPSLMLDDFMGSDFSYDDFVKMSYMADDYDATLLDEEALDGVPVYHLELLPKPDAPVTYGKLEVWLRKEDAGPVRWAFYNEKLKHIRTLYFSDFKDFGGHVVPAVWRMENLADPSRGTTVTIVDARYGTDIPDKLFTRPNLEKYP
ncbi:MAG: outer membrane lipoprotein-sorting protein [Candidatus Omnitrophica bacterium]|nr:outer membrane lipoprotein-sorting protein [Candidatus Omnitrophota bacterium]